MPQGATQWFSIIWIVGMLVLFYFLFIRPQKTREKKDKEMRNAIKTGDKIVTIGGFCGKILTIREDSIVIEVGADRTKLELKKWAIQSVEADKAE